MADNHFPAFPFEYETGDGTRITHNGMTLRDYFAGQAIASLPIRSWDHIKEQSLFEVWAKSAYALADAMLKARTTSGEE